MRNVFYLACVLLLLPIVAVSAVNIPRGIIESPVRIAPAIKLADMDGHTKDLHDYRGKWVFVHFWASWCGPCRKEIPHIQTLKRNMQGQGLAFMIINTAESEDTVFAFLGGIAPELNSLLDRDGLVTEQWQPRGLPATYLIDPRGIIRYQALGRRLWHENSYIDFLKSMLKNP